MHRTTSCTRANAGGSRRLAILAAACSLGVGGCGGGSPPAPATATYRVVASVSGLEGSGLVLHSSVGDDLPVAANGQLAFPTRAPGGTTVTVTIAHQPTFPWQTCAVSGGGTVGSQDLSVGVACVTDRFRVGGSVSGLTGTGLVLRNRGGDDLSVEASGGFTFATRIASGSAYEVTVAAQPAGQACSVTGGRGTVGGADVTSVSVACVPLYRIVAGVSGLAGVGLVLHSSLGDDLAVAASGEVAFPTLAPSGTSYEVTVGQQPTSPWQTCAATAGASGTVGSADANVTVACVTRSFGVGGTVRGLVGSGLVLRNGADQLPVAANGAFTFPTPVLSGATYGVSVGTPPGNPGQICTAENGAGTVAGADVTDVLVWCSSRLQGWSAPTTWGGLWADGPTMLQHAHFEATGIVSDKGPTLAMAGGAEPTPLALTGLPAPVGTRHAGGPFPVEAVSYRGANASALDLPGDMLVCAVVKPARNRPDGYESPIIGKGIGDGTNTLAGGGWVLHQMHQSFCFHYEYRDGNGDTHQFMSPVIDFFADQDFFGTLDPPQQLPVSQQEPSPSFLVACGGRHGDQIVIAVNSWTLGARAQFSLTRTQDQLEPNPFPGPYTLDAAVTRPLTIGGHDATSSALHAVYPAAFQGEHTFDGYVFETAVWSEAATAENIQAKMAPFLGADPSAAYARNREGASLGGDGRMHVVGRHAPRLDPAQGQLFGLQSWNRVSYWIEGNAIYPHPMVFAAGENLDTWTRTPATGGSAPTIALDPAVSPPGDTPLRLGQLVSLPAGAALSIELDQAPSPGPADPVPVPHVRDRPTWDATGPIQGQLWLRPGSAGTLRIQKTDPAPGHGTSCTVLGVAGTPCEGRDVDLSTLASGGWSRVSLNGAFTADAAVDVAGRTLHRGTLVLANPGPGTIRFHAWGVQLTQLGGGGDLGVFDPGELMYDWSASRGNDGEPPDDPWYTVDVLALPPVPDSTAGSGFCLGVDATMPAGLPWSAPFTRARTAIAWVDDPASPARTARLYVAGQDGSADAGKLCFAVTGGAKLCAPLPSAWSADGAPHGVKACMSAARQMRLYGDDLQLASASAGIATPDLGGGTVLVGNGGVAPGDELTPWHGYLSRALVCRDTGDAADCR